MESPVMFARVRLVFGPWRTPLESGTRTSTQTLVPLATPPMVAGVRSQIMQLESGPGEKLKVGGESNVIISLASVTKLVGSENEMCIQSFARSTSRPLAFEQSIVTVLLACDVPAALEFTAIQFIARLSPAA